MPNQLFVISTAARKGSKRKTTEQGEAMLRARDERGVIEGEISIDVLSGLTKVQRRPQALIEIQFFSDGFRWSGTFEQLHEALKSQNKEISFAGWTVSDLIEHAEKEEVELSEEEAGNILTDMLNNCEAGAGVPWEMVADRVDRFIEERDQTADTEV